MTQERFKQCPNCQNFIPEQASVCANCNSVQTNTIKEKKPSRLKKIGSGILVFFFLCIGLFVIGSFFTNDTATPATSDRANSPEGLVQAQTTQTPTLSSIANQTEAIAPTDTPEPVPTLTKALASGPTFEEICNVSRRNLTEPQLEAHVRGYEGQVFSNWEGWVYDVVSRGGGYNLHIAMEKRGLLWSRKIEIENIPDDLAIRLNVEQPIYLSGYIAKVETTFGTACNPMIVTDYTLSDR